MADFLTRVELIEGDDSHYVALDQAMLGANFATSVVSGQGVEYRMPKATYYSHSVNMSARDVRDLAMKAASAIGPRYDIVTTSGEMAYFLHPSR